MPTYTISWEIAGEVQLSRTLTRLAIDLHDFRVPLKQVGKEVVYPEIRNQFGKEGDPGHWPRLSPGYARWKARHHIGAPMLVASGALRASLTFAGAPGAIYDLTKEQLTIGTSLQTPGGKWNLGLIHQQGAPRAHIPARPMLKRRVAAQGRAVTIFSDWFAEMGRKAEVSP